MSPIQNVPAGDPAPSAGERFYRHGLRRMTGRDTGEHHRTASVLELFFDLTFVTAFGVAGSQLAHGIAEDHAGAAVIAFAIAILSIMWAWVGYTWLATSFDNDDWLFRVLTLVQMAGVIVVAVGIPDLFTSVREGEDFHVGVMVTGYVIMRVGVVAMWLRAAHDDPASRSLAMTNAVSVGVAQIGWVAWLLLPLSFTAALVWLVIIWILDLGGPILAEFKGRRRGGGFPWHAHHIAERYGLLAIIAIGESITGTLAAAQMISDAEGWTVEAVVTIAAGVLISFSLWWTYFVLPSGPVLDVRRDKVIPWAYVHIVLFAAIAAIGAGLHVLGYVFDEHYHVSTFAGISSIAIPVLIFMAGVFVLLWWLLGTPPRNIGHVVTFAMPVVAMVLAAVGWPLWACLLIVLISPLSVIVFYETFEWRLLADRLDVVIDDAADAR